VLGADFGPTKKPVLAACGYRAQGTLDVVRVDGHRGVFEKYAHRRPITSRRSHGHQQTLGPLLGEPSRASSAKVLGVGASFRFVAYEY